MAADGKEPAEVTETTAAEGSPPSPLSRLMHFLDCVGRVLDLDHIPGVDRLRDSDHYQQLGPEEVHLLVRLCSTLRPAALEGKVFFNDEEFCGDSPNKFYRLGEAKGTMPERVVIAGQVLAVKGAMAYKGVSWLEDNFTTPMRQLGDKGVLSPQSLPPSSATIQQWQQQQQQQQQWQWQQWQQQQQHVVINQVQPVIIQQPRRDSDHDDDTDCCCIICQVFLCLLWVVLCILFPPLGFVFCLCGDKK